MATFGQIESSWREFVSLPADTKPPPCPELQEDYRIALAEIDLLRSEAGQLRTERDELTKEVSLANELLARWKAACGHSLEMAEELAKSQM